MARVKLLKLLERTSRVPLHGPHQYLRTASLTTTASKELTSLLFPSASWPYASAVVRELLYGSRNQATALLEDVNKPAVAQEAPVASNSQPQNADVSQLVDLVGSSSADSEGIPRQVTQLLQRLCPQLETLPPPETTRLVAALADLQVKDALVDIVLEAVSDIVADNVKQYTAPQLATIAGAYMQLDHKGYGYTLLLDAIVCQVLRSFKDLNASGLVSLTHALAEVEHNSEGTGKLLRAIAAGALDLVPTFSPGQLVSLLSSFSALRHHDAAMFNAVARRAAASLDALTSKQQADLLHALALLGHKDADLVDTLQTQLLEKAGELEGATLCDVLWSLGAYGQLTPEAFQHLCAELEKKSLRAFEPEDFQRLYLVEKIAQAGPPPEAATLRLPEWMRGYVARAWQDRSFAERNFTPLQQGICRVLADMGISHEERFVHNVTSGITLPPKVVIIPEGPANCSSSLPRRPLGETLAVRRLLAALGWTVLPVAKHEWQVMSDAKRRTFLSKLIEDAR